MANTGLIIVGLVLLVLGIGAGSYTIMEEHLWGLYETESTPYEEYSIVLMIVGIVVIIIGAMINSGNHKEVVHHHVHTPEPQHKSKSTKMDKKGFLSFMGHKVLATLFGLLAILSLLFLIASVILGLGIATMIFLVGVALLTPASIYFARKN